MAQVVTGFKKDNFDIPLVSSLHKAMDRITYSYPNLR